MNILYDNKAEGASLSATNGNDSFPVADLLDDFLEKKFQAIGTTSLITIGFSVDTDISCVAIGFHNLSAGTWTLKNSVGGTLLSGALAVAEETDMTYFAETSCRSVELDLTSTEILFLGGVSVGAPLFIEFFNANPRLDFFVRDKKTVYRGGQATTVRTRPLIRYRATLGDISSLERKELWAMIEMVGNWSPVYFDLQEDSHDEARPIHGLMNTDNQYPRDTKVLEYSTTLVCEETR